jgi:Domain of unknown function (DUF4160)
MLYRSQARNAMAHFGHASDRSVQTTPATGSAGAQRRERIVPRCAPVLSLRVEQLLQPIARKEWKLVPHPGARCMRALEWATRLGEHVHWKLPTVLRSGLYLFFFYSADRNEPSHVHVEREESEVKFWLAPVRMARKMSRTLRRQWA